MMGLSKRGASENTQGIHPPPQYLVRVEPYPPGGMLLRTYGGGPFTVQVESCRLPAMGPVKSLSTCPVWGYPVWQCGEYYGGPY